MGGRFCFPASPAAHSCKKPASARNVGEKLVLLMKMFSGRRSSSPKPPLPVLEPVNAIMQIRHMEIRPQGFREHELRIRALPKQEIAQAHLAAGADHQIHVRDAGGVQLVFKGRCVDVLRGDAALGRLPGQGLGGADQFCTSAVVDRILHLD